MDNKLDRKKRASTPHILSNHYLGNRAVQTGNARESHRHRECVPLSYGPRKIRMKMYVFRRSILCIFNIVGVREFWIHFVY